MTTLLRAELLKLRTTRAPFWILSGGAVALLVLAGVGLSLAGRHGAPDLGSYRLMRSAITSITQLAPGAMLVLAILATGGEFQHRTITTTLLVTPSRTKVLLAKLTTFVLLGAGFATALLLLVGGTAIGWQLVAGETPDLRLALVPAAAGVVAITALYAVAGVAIGALARGTTAAVVAAVAWTSIVEGILQVVLGPSRSRWLPGPASDALVRHSDGMLSPWAGGGVFAVYVAVIAAVAGVMWLRRDAV